MTPGATDSSSQKREGKGWSELWVRSTSKVEESTCACLPLALPLCHRTAEWAFFSFSFFLSLLPPVFGKSATTLGYHSSDRTNAWQETLGLIQGPSAVLRATKTGDLDIFDGELVVIGDFLVHINVLLRVDDYLLLRLHCNDFSITIWLKRQN